MTMTRWLFVATMTAVAAVLVVPAGCGSPQWEASYVPAKAVSPAVLAARAAPDVQAGWVDDNAQYNRYLGYVDERTPRFVSVELQLANVDLRRQLPGLDWIIQGGESGNSSRPFDVAWARDVQDQCREAGVNYFLKQLGSKPLVEGVPLRLRDGHGADWGEWPEDLRVREVPSAMALGDEGALSQGGHPRAKPPVPALAGTNPSNRGRCGLHQGRRLR